MGIFTPRNSKRITELENRVNDHEQRLRDIESQVDLLTNETSNILDNLGGYADLDPGALEEIIDRLDRLEAELEAVTKIVASEKGCQVAKCALKRLRNHRTRAKNALAIYLN